MVVDGSTPMVWWYGTKHVPHAVMYGMVWCNNHVQPTATGAPSRTSTIPILYRLYEKKEGFAAVVQCVRARARVRACERVRVCVRVRARVCARVRACGVVGVQSNAPDSHYWATSVKSSSPVMAACVSPEQQKKQKNKQVVV